MRSQKTSCIKRPNLVKSRTSWKKLRRLVAFALARDSFPSYLHEVSYTSYKNVNPITANHNSLKSKLQFQYASRQYIQALSKRKRIINMYESILRIRIKLKKAEGNKKEINNIQDNSYKQSNARNQVRIFELQFTFHLTHQLLKLHVFDSFQFLHL